MIVVVFSPTKYVYKVIKLILFCKHTHIIIFLPRDVLFFTVTTLGASTFIPSFKIPEFLFDNQCQKLVYVSFKKGHLVVFTSNNHPQYSAFSSLCLI